MSYRHVCMCVWFISHADLRCRFFLAAVSVPGM
jgi:hypothetical protein